MALTWSVETITLILVESIYFLYLSDRLLKMKLNHALILSPIMALSFFWFSLELVLPFSIQTTNQILQNDLASRYLSQQLKPILIFILITCIAPIFLYLINANYLKRYGKSLGEVLDEGYNDFIGQIKVSYTKDFSKLLGEKEIIYQYNPPKPPFWAYRNEHHLIITRDGIMGWFTKREGIHVYHYYGRFIFIPKEEIIAIFPIKWYKKVKKKNGGIEKKLQLFGLRLDTRDYRTCTINFKYQDEEVIYLKLRELFGDLWDKLYRKNDALTDINEMITHSLLES